MTSDDGGGAAPPSLKKPDREFELGGPRELPQTHFSRALDWVITKIGDAISWLWVFLVLIIVLNVTMRYLFAEGRVELEELQWHLYAIGFLIGLSYCMVSDSHIRVDVFHMGFSLKVKAWIELIGLVFFLLPFVIFVTYHSIPFIGRSMSVPGTGKPEISDAPGGLPFCLALPEDFLWFGDGAEICFPYRWHIKLFLAIGFILLLVAAISRLSRVTSHLFGFPRALPKSGLDKPSGF